MNASELIFGIKDVVAIIIGLGSIVSFVYVIKSSSEKANIKISEVNDELDEFKKVVNEKFLHSKNTKKATVEYIMDTVEKKENLIYTKISEIKSEQEVAHNKLWNKLDTVEKMQQNISNNLAELTGYLKAKNI
jgi:gas vesicle protein